MKRKNKKLLANSIKLVSMIFLGLALGLHSCTKQHSETSLKEAYNNQFLIGCALNTAHLNGEDTVTTRLVKKHFNAVVAENIMKPASIQPEQGVFNFSESDVLVDFALQNNLFITGHTLVWHNQVPDWIFTDEAGNDVSRDTLLSRMRQHIHTVVGRYKGQVNGWDVVNEAVDAENGLRSSKWLQIIGEDYIEHAFRFAHEADPEAGLYYNDYNMFDSAKRDNVIKLVRGLQQKGIRIDGIGMQGHYHLEYPPLQEIEKSIVAFSELGVQVMITELDISVLPFPDGQLTAEVTRSYAQQRAFNPYPSVLPDSVQLRLAERYASLFRLFSKHSGKISRVTFWGVNDGDSWKNNWPIPGRTDYPLLFDRNNEPKPAFDSVIYTAKKKY